MHLRRFLVIALLIFAPLSLHAQREKLPPEDLEIVEKEWPDAERSFTGLRWVVTRPGTGELIQPGDEVSVIYTGKFLDGKVFDKALDPKEPFKFRVARGMVIDGWEEVFQKMRLGEKRVVIVPFELGYGSRGQPPHIPRRATLVFDIEVIGVEKVKK